MSAPRDFAAELAAARAAEDWEAHSRIWEERRGADVDADERRLEAARAKVASDPRNQEFPEWCLSVLQGEHDDCSDMRAALGD